MSEYDRDGALSCPICMEIYSDTRYPIAPYCGHAICKECGDKRKSNQCVLCMQHCFYDVANKTSPWPSDEWEKNFALLDLVHLHCRKMKSVETERNELKTKFESVVSIIPNSADYKKCSPCDTMEKKERLKICGTCAHQVHVAWKKMDEEEIWHTIVCAHCCLKEHSGHKLIDYLVWKQGQMVSAISRNTSTFSLELHKGEIELGKWIEAVNSFSSIKLYSEGERTLIASSLKLESNLVKGFSEDCLPKLKNYCQVVNDSTARLQLLRSGVNKDGKVDFQISQFVRDMTTKFADLKVSPSSSQMDIQKRDYEETIRKLEQKLKDNEKKLKESSVAVKKTNTVFLSRHPTIDHHDEWNMHPDADDCLHFTVSHKMTLVAIEMYGARRRTQAFGHFRIYSPEEDILIGQDYPLWNGTANLVEKHTLANPVKLFPRKKYLLEVHVDRPTKTYYGRDGVKKNVISPGQMVTFSKYHDENNETDVFWGQFAGFYFLVDEL